MTKVSITSLFGLLQTTEGLSITTEGIKVLSIGSDSKEISV